MFVYLLRNTVTGKCYVGKTTRTVQFRWRQHKTEMRIGRYSTPLYEAMREFGVDAFEVSVLGECDSQRRLAQMERAFIRRFNSVESGYNTAVASFGGRIKNRSQSSITRTLSNMHRMKIAESVRMAWRERGAMEVNA